MGRVLGGREEHDESVARVVRVSGGRRERAGYGMALGL